MSSTSWLSSSYPLANSMIPSLNCVNYHEARVKQTIFRCWGSLLQLSHNILKAILMTSSVRCCFNLLFHRWATSLLISSSEWLSRCLWRAMLSSISFWYRQVEPTLVISMKCCWPATLTSCWSTKSCFDHLKTQISLRVWEPTSKEPLRCANNDLNWPASSITWMDSYYWNSVRPTDSVRRRHTAVCLNQYGSTHPLAGRSLARFRN